MKQYHDSAVLHEIRKRIFDRRILPGDPLKVLEISDDLGVSTAPTRDALMRLTERGLVNRIDGRGFFVSVVNETEVFEIVDSLHFIIKLSISRNGIINRKSRVENVSQDNLIDTIVVDDAVNYLLDSICSVSLSKSARSLADRLMVTRQMAACRKSSGVVAVRIADLIIKAVGSGKQRHAHRIIDLVYKQLRCYLKTDMAGL
jgi:DNA-binding transcriptional regulator YhcF (GntR family)